MKYESQFEDESEIDDLPVSPLLSQERKNRYGSVPGLDDEELADPVELERQVMIQEWGPVLALPVRGRQGWVRPNIDEDGNVDFGAFATVDFERIQPEFDKLRYKVDKLREELRNVFIMLETIGDRLPPARHAVLKWVQRGVLDMDDIASEDMRAFVRYYRRAVRLEEQLTALRKAGLERRRKRLGELLA
jgi:hypothetical protein